MEKYNERVVFWQRLWEDSIKIFITRAQGLSLQSPHILIEDLITELVENRIFNATNRNYFYQDLSDFWKNDFVIKKHFQFEFELLRRKFKSQQNGYLINLLLEIKNKFDKGLYFDEILNRLCDLLSNHAPLDESSQIEIEDCSNKLIIELLKKGFSFQDIGTFAFKVLTDYSIVEQFVQTDYPHGFDRLVLSNPIGSFRIEELQTDIIAMMNSLTLRERIHRLSYFFYMKPIKVFYVFVVEGLRGKEQKQIGDMVFYSPYETTMFEKESEIDVHDLLQGSEKDKFIEVAVPVDMLLAHSSLAVAQAKIESALDLINSHFQDSPFTVNKLRFMIATSDKRYYYSSWSTDNEARGIKYAKAIEIEHVELSDFNTDHILLSSQLYKSDLQRKLLYSIHWLAKGKKAAKTEDRILNYWIAIEHIFSITPISSWENYFEKRAKAQKINTIDIIASTIAAIELLEVISDYAFDLYRDYTSRAHRFPEELTTNAGLHPLPGSVIKLYKFVQHLKQIKVLEVDKVMIKKIGSVEKFYNDQNYCKKFLEERFEIVKKDVFMIYRLRNLIVHNARFEINTVPYFEIKAQHYASRLIHCITNKAKPGIGLPDIIVRIILEKDLLLSDVKAKLNSFLIGS